MLARARVYALGPWLVAVLVALAVTTLGGCPLTDDRRVADAGPDAP